MRQNSNDDWLKCNCTGSGGSPLFGPIRTQNSVASIFLSAEIFHSAHIEVENRRQQWVLTCICLDFHSQLYMGGRFPRVFGDEFGDKFGDDFSELLNSVMNLVENLATNLVIHQNW